MRLFYQQRSKAILKIFRRAVVKRIVTQSRAQGKLTAIFKVAVFAILEMLFKLCGLNLVLLAIKVWMNQLQCLLTIQVSTSV
jgi:hypothetical protein